MPITCILFDFDGVISDTERYVQQYLLRAFAMHGVTLSEADLLSSVGINGGQWLQEMLTKYRLPLTLEEFQQQRRQLGNHYENGPELSPMPGVVAFLTHLRQSGRKTGVVSSSSTKPIVMALNRMGMMNLFDAIICGDMVSKMKPDPECYHKAMGLLGVVPKQCLILEDSPVGICAAKASGATVIAFKGGSIPQDTSGADEELQSFFDWKQHLLLATMQK